MADSALRRNHELAQSERGEVEADIRYRRGATNQIVRRLRDLDMPLEEIRAVLDASDVETRNRVIDNHLCRLESNLARTQMAARALRDLLDGE